MSERVGTLGRRQLLIEGSMVAAKAASVGVVVLLLSSRPENFRRKVMEFTWADAQDPLKRDDFTKFLADKYVEGNPATDLSPEALVDPDKLLFLPDRDEYVAKKAEFGIKEVPSFALEYGHYIKEGGYILIDWGTLSLTRKLQKFEAGISLLHALDHEWGHKDREERTEGEWINDLAHTISKEDGSQDPWAGYFGGQVFSAANYWAYGKFEEVWNESTTRRRIQEQVGIQRIPPSAYQASGTDFLIPFERALKIPLEVSKNMHRGSDREGYAKLIADRLPEDFAMTSVAVNNELFPALDGPYPTNFEKIFGYNKT